MLRTLAAFSRRRFDIRTQLNARGQATPFVFRIGLAMSLLVLSVAATPTCTTAQTGQPSTPQDHKRIAAGKLAGQARELERQGTAESKRQAIEKYKESLLLWRATGDRYWEAWTLFSIGDIYKDFNEYQQALEYFEQALAIRRAIRCSDKVGDGKGRASRLKLMCENQLPPTTLCPNH